MINNALVVDDDAMDRELIQEGLGCLEMGIDVETASDGQEACEIIGEKHFDIVFADLCMPHKDGIDVLDKVNNRRPGTEVVIVTGDGEIQTAVRAMKKGCFDYLQKPISIDEVEAVVTRLNRHLKVVRENNYFRSELGKNDAEVELIGQSKIFRQFCSQAVQVAPTDATVLLQGESGTGKELMARLIHDASPREGEPFIRVNCAALSETLLESELFGHKKGAFTGATESRPGRFELADGGTIMLDEVTETSENLQAELLRVIEAKEFERVGGTETIHVDVRIIATTNRDIAQAVEEGKFREDLFYRLNVVPIELPPLRERDGDVPLLATCFARRISRELGRRCPEFSDEAMEKLQNYSWPGNVRELENLIQRVLIMSPGNCIQPEDLPGYLDDDVGLDTDALLEGDRTLEDIERQAILGAINEADGNKTQAAETLGISPRTVWNKLQKYEEDGVLPEKFAS